MAQLGMFFDPNEVPPSEGFELLPPGNYRVQITDADVRPTKDGRGRFVWTEMEVLDGEYANRKLWHNFNIKNDSEKAQQIGLSQLSALCHAIAVMGMEDTDELKFKPFVVSVGTQAPKDGYDAQNRIKNFKPNDQASGGLRSARPARAYAGPVNGQGSPGARQAPARAGGAPGGSGGQPWKARAAGGRTEQDEDRRQERINQRNEPGGNDLDDSIPF
jgi:hypothetical protein